MLAMRCGGDELYDVSMILKLNLVKALNEKTAFETLDLSANIHYFLGLQWTHSEKHNYSQDFHTMLREIEQRYVLCRQFLS